MALFNFFGETEHRVFNYKPIYYDPEKEALKKRFRAVDGTREKEAHKEDGTYVPGSYVRGSMRDGRYKRTRSHASKAQSFIGLIGLLMFALAMIYFTKLYALFI